MRNKICTQSDNKNYCAKILEGYETMIKYITLILIVLDVQLLGNIYSNSSPTNIPFTPLHLMFITLKYIFSLILTK